MFPTTAALRGCARQAALRASQWRHVPRARRLTGCLHGRAGRSRPHGARRAGRRAGLPDAGAPPCRPRARACAAHPRQRGAGRGDRAGCVAARLDQCAALAARGRVPHLALSHRRQSLPQRKAPSGATCRSRRPAMWPIPRPAADASCEAARARPAARRRGRRRCRRASAPRSCSPIRKGSAMPRPRPCSIRRSPASRRCWCAPSATLRAALDRIELGGAHDDDHELEAALRRVMAAESRRCAAQRVARRGSNRCRRRSAPSPGGRRP